MNSKLLRLSTLIALTTALLNTGRAQIATHYGSQALIVHDSNPNNEFEGIAVDSSGNVYIADPGTNNVYKETLSGGAYTESVLFNQANNGLKIPVSVAIDSSGNLYISDSLNERVLKETLSAGSYTQSLIIDYHSGLIFPAGLAVDSSGNVYITDPNNNRVLKETASAGSYVQSTIGTGIKDPLAVAVDSSGNVYINDNGNSRVLKETLSAGSYTQSIVAADNSFIQGMEEAEGVAVDSSGNVYIASYDFSGLYGSSVLKATPQAGGYELSIAGVAITDPWDLAVDPSGSVYISGFFNEITKLSWPPTNFGPVNVASSGNVDLLVDANLQGVSGPVLSFPFTAGNDQRRLAFGAAVSLGVSGEFLDTGTGTCDTNGANYAYVAGQTCTINVSFNPQFAGTRKGAVEFLDKFNNVVATEFTTGVGVGPAVAFTPGTPSAVASGFASPSGVAVTGSGTVFVADSGTRGTLFVETPSGNSYTQSTINETGNAPLSEQPILQGVAVDGAGNLYVSDSYDESVFVREYYNGTDYANTTLAYPNEGNGLQDPQGLAADTAGDVYIADTGNNRVLEENYSSGTTFSAPPNFPLQFVVDASLSAPKAVAVDGSGNVYIADTGNNRVVKDTPTGAGFFVQSIVNASLNAPAGVAVDDVGNIYIADTGNHQVLEEMVSGGSYTQSVVVAGLGSPTALTLDASGDLFIADAGNKNVVKLTLSAPSLSFASTAVGSTSTDSPQTVTLQNIGTAPLTFPLPGSGTNPSISAGFTLNSTGGTACPLLTSFSGSSASVAANTTCTLPISFSPTTPGNVSGSLVITDNSVNLGTTQTIPLNGTATGVVQTTPTITWPTPAAITYGTALSATQLDATASVPGTFVYTPSSGVLPAGVHTLSVSFTPTDTTDYASVPVTTVQLTVNQATPTITWPTPAAITYGTALSATQLDASAPVAGTFSYTPASGVLAAGSQTLSVVFTPSDTTDYTTNSAQVSLTVNRAALTVTANDTSRAVGAANPAFTASYSGFVNGDSTAVLSGSPALSTSATTSSPAGNYPITASQGTLTAANYTFAFVNGTLSVVTAPTTVLTSTATLSAVAGGYQAVVTVTNSGTAPASNVTLTSATLGSAPGTPTPQSIGTLNPGATNSFTVTFPASAGNPGTAVPEKYSGTYTGGSFSASIRAATLP